MGTLLSPAFLDANESCAAVSAPNLDCIVAVSRDTPRELRAKRDLLAGLPLLQSLIDAMPTMVAILNARRQIIAGNKALWTILGTTLDDAATQRPGEVLACVHAQEGPDGCGTGPHCTACGAVRAVLASQRSGATMSRECRLLTKKGQSVQALDLRLMATPLTVGDETFFIVAIEDLSQAKRLEVLQRTFFHDVLNTAGCLRGYGQYLTELNGADDVYQRVEHLADELIETISAQRDLVLAESGDLPVRQQTVSTRSLLEELRKQYLGHPRAEGRRLTLAGIWDGTLATDGVIVRRVLGNMILNALEATPHGGAVTIGCVDRDVDVAFYVHNVGEMSDEVRLQIFQRSFSTKADNGRGIGTYSMKLFGERYLGGQVAFTSELARGTTFWLTLPKQA